MPKLISSTHSFAEWIILCLSKSNLKNKLCNIAEFPGGISDCDSKYQNIDWEVKIIKNDNSEYQEGNVEDDIDFSNPLENLDEKWREKILTRFNFKYPHDDFIQLPLKVSASKLTHESQWENYIANSKPEFLYGQNFSSTDRGTVLHKFMCYVNLQNALTNGVRKELSRLVDNNFLSKEEAKLISIHAIEKFIQGPLAKRMINSSKLMREHRFSVKIPINYLKVENIMSSEEDAHVFMQGALDCAFLEHDGYTIVDYKTDKVSDLAELYERYSKQLRLYKYSLENIENVPVKELIIYSFHLNDYYSFN